MKLTPCEILAYWDMNKMADMLQMLFPQIIIEFRLQCLWNLSWSLNNSKSVLIQVMVWCHTGTWYHQAITWTIWFSISEVLWHSPGSTFTASAQAIICIVNEKIILLKLLPHLAGANELKYIKPCTSFTLVHIFLSCMWLLYNKKTLVVCS